ncbi:LLM class flavin-dependent oxidoreductase [Williamsia sterculiae]|uniref:Luciferase family oxidoreductase, group 1 n=1 Tax=Williamsia sterculiae TaxID=1344003 RepID=A0A1N7EZB6_9NOCA|nr:LLM class flavin-dependent oxidoreductase [Williamsia sterculiae]SIR93429.1 luciferase family oxidoreductase, group 1 [Williamsia sterculiae]
MTGSSAPPVPLSVLDLSPVVAGSTPAEALRHTVALAQHAEALGYHRFWLAEHHFVAVASSSTTTLLALVAAATERIRIGSAAVQLGHHTPASVVEAFGTIDALHPGRLDLGLGRSGQKRGEALAAARQSQVAGSNGSGSNGSGPNGSGSTPPSTPEHVVDGLLIPQSFPLEKLLGSPRIAASAAALQQPGAATPDFDAAVADILALLDGTFTVDGHPLSAVPGEHADVEVWIFGSSKGQSAQVAGARGLPFVANYHVSPATTLEAVEAYRAAFRPSDRLSQPYVVVSADVVVAEDTPTAEHLAATYGHWVHSIRAGGGAAPYPDPRTTGPLDDDQRAVVADRTRTQFVGDAGRVAERLQTLARVTGADELVITSVTHDADDRRRSHELLAREWGLVSASGRTTPSPAAPDSPAASGRS